MTKLEAEGINGATLLGFLAAVGSLRLLAEKYPSARLWFDPDGDRARLSVDELDSDETIASLISDRYFSAERTKELDLLGTAAMPKSISNEDDENNVPNVSKLAERASTEPNLTMWSFVTGVLCDGLTKKNDKQLAAETVLCAANGASHQKMFQTIRDLGNLEFDNEVARCPSPPLVTPEHLRCALTGTWKFADTVPADAVGGKGWMGNRKPTLRWDESAERLHALRLHEPTADPEAFATQLGAYALATAALACFVTFPVRGGGITAFTRRHDASELIFHWPLWDVPMSLATFLATHASGEALREPADARLRGVYRLMGVRRMTQDKGKLTFQSPEAVW
ncbi:MAG: type I-G CRISPR-associated protein, Cas3-extension family [Betaproteobacteria bacterium]